jgi:hypothetical protein
MTQQKNLKQRIRQRMEKTGESYASARRMTLQQAPPAHDHSQPFMHMPGSVPGATALRSLLANAGLRADHDGKPYSEAMIFGIAGGIGAGVFSFHYAKENLSTFYIAGRHLWHDDLGYLRAAAQRMGAKVEVKETGGAKQAASQLDAALKQGPAIAWVDMAELGTRGLPDYWSGGGYHVLVVFQGKDGDYVLGDLADQPARLPAKQLAKARGRIKKDKHRLLQVVQVPARIDLHQAVTDGLRACHHGLTNARLKNFTLQAFAKWAKDLRSEAKDGWGQMFNPGPNLWRGLTSVYDFIEHYGTGGGLCRPLFADFLEEAGQLLAAAPLQSLAERYRGLGQGWTELAQLALPGDAGALARARQLLDEKAERYLVEGASSKAEYESLWSELMALGGEAGTDFPLSAKQVLALRQRLADKVEVLHADEAEALVAMEAVVAELAA